MTRVEECSNLIKEANENLSSLTSKYGEPNFIEQLTAGIEAAKVTVLMDIALSLATLADGLSDD